ncbi:MAG: hypothetical protein H0X13_03740 [Ramlibacter sp.]|nr:hypothetical protein [Ramlibacter sp.]
MSMTIRFMAALLVAVPLFALAQPADPVGSAACLAARAELESALDDGADPRARRLASARRQVAMDCLGPAKGKPLRSGAPQPVQAVPMIAPAPLPPMPAGAPLPPLPISRPVVITTCDPAGCWDSDGRRLNQIGPMLMGPRGPCSAQGGGVNCP